MRVFLETETHTHRELQRAKNGGWEENRIGWEEREFGTVFLGAKGEGGGGTRRRKSELDTKSKLSIRKALEAREEGGENRAIPL